MERRRDDQDERGAIVIWAQRWLQLLISLGVIVSLGTAGLTHFASASEVNGKFAQISLQMESLTLSSRKERYEDELFRLRNMPQSPQTDALIRRYEDKMDDLSARLRDIEKAKRGK